MNTNIIFPQTPIFDVNGNMSLEWIRYLQNLQFFTNDIAEIVLAFQAMEATGSDAAALLQKVTELQNEVASIDSPNAVMAKLASQISELKTQLAIVIEPNLGPVIQRINDIEIAGIFI